MALFDRLLGRKGASGKTPLNGVGTQKQSGTDGGHRLHTKAEHRPIFARVGPGNAVSTPRRYDRLADEGYRQNVIAYRAVNLVAKAVASIPLVLMRGDERIAEHPLLTLLARPNPKLKGENFLYNFVGYYLIAGNAYGLKVGPDGGIPKELWLLRPDTMQVVEGTDGLPAGFEQQLAGKKQRFDAESVLHVKTFNPLSDWYGLAPLEAAALAVDGHNESSRWNLALVQNGGTPSGVLYQDEADAPLTDAQFDKLKSEIETQYTGAVNAGRPLLLEGGLKWLSPKDMDWASSKNMSAREIALAFGVPPQMMGVPDAQTYANYAEARQSLWEDTIIPLAQDIAQELTNWLVPDFDGDTQPLQTSAGQTSARGSGKQGLKLMLDLDDVPALAAKRAAKFDRIANAAFLSDEEKRKVLGFGYN